MKRICTSVWLVWVLMCVGGPGLPAGAALIVDLPFTGNALDASGFGHHGSVTGATLTEDRFGRPGSAYRFDGVNDFIMLDGRITPATYTLAAWVSTTSTKTDSAIIRNRWYGWGMWYGSGNAAFGGYIGNAQSVSGRAYRLGLDDGAWHHLAQTFDGTTMRGYVDGVKVWESFPSAQLTTAYYIGSSAVGLGRDGDADWLHFEGDIDDVQIYDEALSDAAIHALASNVPEPASLGVLGVGGLLVLRRRRH